MQATQATHHTKHTSSSLAKENRDTTNESEINLNIVGYVSIPESKQLKREEALAHAKKISPNKRIRNASDFPEQFSEDFQAHSAMVPSDTEENSKASAPSKVPTKLSTLDQSSTNREVNGLQTAAFEGTSVHAHEENGGYIDLSHSEGRFEDAPDERATKIRATRGPEKRYAVGAPDIEECGTIGSHLIEDKDTQSRKDRIRPTHQKQSSASHSNGIDQEEIKEVEGTHNRSKGLPSNPETRRPPTRDKIATERVEVNLASIPGMRKLG